MQSLAKCLANSKSSVGVSHYHCHLSVLTNVGKFAGRTRWDEGQRRIIRGKNLERILVMGWEGLCDG